MTEIDRIDIRILELLQRNTRVSHAVMGESVHLSASQVSRRVHRLEEVGAVSAYVALLNPKVIGLDVEAYTYVSLDRHDLDNGEAFERGIQDFDEILECLSVSGEADYILRIVAADLDAFSSFLSQKLMKLPGIKMVHSNIGLRRIKGGTALPLDYLTRPGKRESKLRFLDD